MDTHAEDLHETQTLVNTQTKPANSQPHSSVHPNASHYYPQPYPMNDTDQSQGYYNHYNWSAYTHSHGHSQPPVQFNSAQMAQSQNPQANLGLPYLNY